MTKTVNFYEVKDILNYTSVNIRMRAGRMEEAENLPGNETFLGFINCIKKLQDKEIEDDTIIRIACNGIVCSLYYKEHIFEIHDGSLSMIYILHDKKDDIYGLMSGRIVSSLEHRTKSCIITDLVIRPEYRRRGLGTELLAKVSQELKEKNIHHIKVNVKNDFTMERFFWIEGFSQSKTIFMDKEI